MQLQMVFWYCDHYPTKSWGLWQNGGYCTSHCYGRLWFAKKWKHFIFNLLLRIMVFLTTKQDHDERMSKMIKEWPHLTYLKNICTHNIHANVNSKICPMDNVSVKIGVCKGKWFTLGFTWHANLSFTLTLIWTCKFAHNIIIYTRHNYF